MGLDRSTIDDDDAIELDKLEIQKLSPKPPDNQVPPQPLSKLTPKEPLASRLSTKGLWWKLSIVTGVLLITAILLLVFGKMNINLPFYTKGTSQTPGNYLRVGPVTATIGSNDIVRLTVEINCKNKKVKNEMSQMDSRIRDKIVNVLNNPDTQRLLISNDYDTLRARIKDNIATLVPDQAVEDIYFSEFLTY